jgi:hypothetical protein
MAESKKSFVLYNDYEEVFSMLTDEEAGKLIKHILAYVNNKNPSLEDRLLQVTFEPIRLQLGRDAKKYEAICERNAINGAKGGRPPKNPRKPKKPSGLIENPENPVGYLETQNNPEKPKKPDNDNDNDTDNGNDNDISIKRESVNDWKKSFEEYKKQVRKAFIEAIQDKTWMQKQQEYYPGVNIKKSLEKACFNYWATEAGWHNKRSKKTKVINWKTTFGNALAMKENHVYNEKFSFNNEKNTAPGIEI